MSPNPVSGALYESAFIYDIAFGYRDYPHECGVLLEWATRARGGSGVKSAVELAAGPADHAMTLRGLGLEAYALDLSETMCEYARQKAKALGHDITVIYGDMKAFQLPKRVDLAITMLNSVAHLHTLDDFIQHLSAVADNLTADGVYILEMQHPKDFVGRGERKWGVGEPWVVKKGEVEVSVRWGRSTDTYHTLSQQFEAHVEIDVNAPEGKTQRLEDWILMRDWTLDELRAAVRLSGSFEISGLYGDFSTNISLTDERAWRMMVVLVRRSSRG